MYRNCIFCAADLGSNASVEHFSVGRSLAFDGDKGRLWAVCPRCARWNLAPIEERWEAIEDAERLYRDTRTRVQRENVGLARLRNGTRLIRIGQAPSGELAAWRYGAELSRRRRVVAMGAATAVAIAAGVTGSAVVGLIGIATAVNLGVQVTMQLGIRTFPRRHVVREFARGTLLPDQVLQVDEGVLRGAHLVADPGGGGPALLLPTAGWGLIRRPDGTPGWGHHPVVIPAADAGDVLRRGLVLLNARGASHRGIGDALGLLSPAGADGFLDRCAKDEMALADRSVSRRERRARLLALEMALHEETERRALEGELATLEAMWREAEAIAAIADRLPDDAVRPEPPRVFR